MIYRPLSLVYQRFQHFLDTSQECHRSCHFFLLKRLYTCCIMGKKDFVANLMKVLMAFKDKYIAIRMSTCCIFFNVTCHNHKRCCL